MIETLKPALVPPFTLDTAIAKVRKAEDNWNSRNPQQVALGYSADSRWRNRSEFLTGRDEIIAFLTRKWRQELEYPPPLQPPLRSVRSCFIAEPEMQFRDAFEVHSVDTGDHGRHGE